MNQEPKIQRTNQLVERRFCLPAPGIGLKELLQGSVRFSQGSIGAGTVAVAAVAVAGRPGVGPNVRRRWRRSLAVRPGAPFVASDRY